MAEPQPHPKFSYEEAYTIEATLYSLYSADPDTPYRDAFAAIYAEEPRLEGTLTRGDICYRLSKLRKVGAVPPSSRQRTYWHNRQQREVRHGEAKRIDDAFARVDAAQERLARAEDELAQAEADLARVLQQTLPSAVRRGLQAEYERQGR